MKALHITQWDTFYEDKETRKIVNLSFYRKKNKLVGLGIGRTLQHDRGLELLGVWSLLEALASLAPRGERGWLMRNGKPLTNAEIAYLLRIPEEPVETAVKHFVTPEIGWLEWGDSPAVEQEHAEGREIAGRLPGDSPAVEQEHAEGREIAGRNSLGERERLNGDGRNGEGREREALAPPLLAEVAQWAESKQVDPAFAETKRAELTERGGWLVRGNLLDWRQRFERLWHGEDGREWRKRHKKTAPAGPKKTLPLETMKV